MLYNRKNEGGNAAVALIIGLAIVLIGVWMFTGISPLMIIQALMEISDTIINVFAH